jgi:pyruvate kinase
MPRRTKIIATIGPASESPEQLAKLIAAGVDVCRLNLSHGTLDEHLGRMAAVRAAAAAAGRTIAVLADLPGPKIRSGSFPDGGVALEAGARIELTAGDGASTDRLIQIDYSGLLDDVALGDRVMLGDGGISMRVVAKYGSAVTAEVESGGRAQGRPGVHITCEELKLRAPTSEDLVLAEAMAAAGADYVALSFARTGDDVDKLRATVGGRSRIMAKIETASAIGQLDDIVEAADAVMVARGDLGIDVPLEEVPHLQKRIIRRCVQAGVPVVTATQMLESMILAPLPTRAEVSDVANAVFDGTDAVMLSGETAIGNDPPNVVRTMSRIAERAEAEASYRQWGALVGRIQRRKPLDEQGEMNARITDSITHAAWQAADDVAAAAIICCTRTGRLGRAMARYRPVARLLAMSFDPVVLASLALSWGVEPVPLAEAQSTDGMVWLAVEKAVASGYVSNGDTVVVIAGTPDRASGAAADVMRIVRVS